MIEAELRDHLVANVPTVSGRVYPVLLPQSPTYPALTYQLISDPRGHTHDGPDGLVDARYQITTWAPREAYADVKATADAVRIALDGFTGIWGAFFVGLIFHDGGVDLYDPDVEVHHNATDYIIRYQEN